MQLTTEKKKFIVEAIVEDLKRRKCTQAQHSRLLQINQAVYSRITGGDTNKTLSEEEWIRVGKRLHVDLSAVKWLTAATITYDYINGQLEAVQNGSLSAINCDIVGIGKSHAAEMYATCHKNVIYVKCRESITRAALIKLLAVNLGLDTSDTVEQIRQSVYLELLKVDRPLIILDDAGYLNNKCWMEVKSLNDDLLYACAFYIIGDTSLKKKIEKLIRRDTIGWKALFDRFNQRFYSMTENFASETELLALQRKQLEQVLAVNLPGIDKKTATDLINKSTLSLRVLRKEIYKLKMAEFSLN